MFEVSNVSANELVSSGCEFDLILDWLNLNVLLESGSLKNGQKKNFLNFKVIKVFILLERGL